MIIFYEKRGFKVQELSYEEIIERYFSSRPLKKEDYETASALIRGVKEKPEGGFLTPLEQDILKRMSSLTEILPE